MSRYTFYCSKVCTKHPVICKNIQMDPIPSIFELLAITRHLDLGGQILIPARDYRHPNVVSVLLTTINLYFNFLFQFLLDHLKSTAWLFRFSGCTCGKLMAGILTSSLTALGTSGFSNLLQTFHDTHICPIIEKAGSIIFAH